MNVITLFVLSASMSADAFAANVAKGAARHSVAVRDLLKTALVFASIEMLTLLLGYGAGSVAVQYIQAYDHWVAFVLLSVLGLKMLFDTEQDEVKNTSASQPSLGVLFITALATGIDSMIMGVSLAMIHAPIVSVLLMVGAVTALLSALGLKLGQILGKMAGKWATRIGGVVLMVMGWMILLQHLNVI